MPVDISEDCQDIIQKMFTVDQQRRITFKEIQNHQWFRGNTDFSPRIFPSRFREVKLTDTKDIDPEIIANMKKFGWTDKKELIRRILESRY